MGFVPPLNLGGFQPSPATLAQWVYQIWQYLQENPIATQEQLQEYIGTFITTSPETQTMIGAGVEEYLTENPPTAPVKSVQGKTGAVQLAYNEIVPASNAVPVYKASSTPETNTLVGQYKLGYRLFVNAATQEIFTISPAGALSLVGRGKFDGTTVDLNSVQGDTTISEAVAAIEASVETLQTTNNNHSTSINNINEFNEMKEIDVSSSGVDFITTDSNVTINISGTKLYRTGNLFYMNLNFAYSGTIPSTGYQDCHFKFNNATFNVLGGFGEGVSGSVRQSVIISPSAFIARLFSAASTGYVCRVFFIGSDIT